MQPSFIISEKVTQMEKREQSSLQISMCPELKELLFLIILRKRACGEEPLAGPKVVGHTHITAQTVVSSTQPAIQMENFYHHSSSLLLIEGAHQ